ncbi:hypothetical protein, partial [Pseudomonas aeruginosa]|uniref:hypothetical protein n=1 Tax=Pseudomonas aeruginosa TaxID=287 RepID=UPI00195546BF
LRTKIAHQRRQIDAELLGFSTTTMAAGPTLSFGAMSATSVGGGRAVAGDFWSGGVGQKRADFLLS